MNLHWRAGGILVALLIMSSAALAIITSGKSGDGGSDHGDHAAALEQSDSSGTFVRTEVPATPTPDLDSAMDQTATPESLDAEEHDSESGDRSGPDDQVDDASVDTEARKGPNDDPTSALETPAPEPTPLPQIGRAQQATFAPRQVRIPKLEVDAPVVSVGVNEAGAMAAPENFADVGWYQHGASPGEQGRAVLAGHVDSYTGPAVFFRLHELQPGDEIFIRSGSSLKEARFVVRESHNYETDLAPVDQIFGSSERHELILITCGGPFDRNSGRYLERHVVYAELQDDVQASAAP